MLDAVANQIGYLGHNQAAGACAYQKHVVDVLVEHQVSYLLGLSCDGDAWANLLAAFAAPFQRWHVDIVSGVAQYFGCGLPDPGTLK